MISKYIDIALKMVISFYVHNVLKHFGINVVEFNPINSFVFVET